MKKLVIGLMIMLGVSVVGASASFGYVLKNDVKTYQTSKEYPLKKEALKKVYIEGNIAINVCATQGQPRVEVESKSLGVFANEPTYKVDIREEGDATYISINREYIGTLGFSFEAQEEATVYLTQQDMDKLDIESSHGYQRGIELEMGEVNIKSIDVDSNYGEVVLNGNYEEINVTGGDVKINSKTPAKVILTSAMNIDLSGQYKDIEINNHRGGSVKVDSQVPVDIEISGEQYYVHDQELVLKGAYKNIDVSTSGGDIIFDFTVAPQRVNVLGEVENINIKLPKDIKGFKVVRRGEVESDEYSDSYDDGKTVSHIYTDFAGVDKKPQENGEVVTYGDGSTKISVESSYQGEISVVEGR